MILRPLSPPSPRPGVLPVWAAVEATQGVRPQQSWLITQPDHAALSGDIAAHLGPPLLPPLSAEVVRGIALHDEGWAEYDRTLPPMSFLDVPVETFLQAWSGSIERAQAGSAIGGVLVSKHFSRIGQARLETKPDSAENDAAIRRFLAGEERRQRRLLGGYRGPDPELLTDVLQFCDLLSLYLCCGTREAVEFPQSFGGTLLRLEPQSGEGAACRVSPSPFAAGGASLAVAGRRPGAGGEARTFAFLLW